MINYLERLRRMGLTERKFMVRVPKTATYTDAEIEAFGIIVDLGKDGKPVKALENELTTVMWDLYTIMDKYFQGYTIRVVNQSDIEVITKLLENKLASLHRSLNVRDEELIEKLKEFANAVLDVNLTYLERREKEKEKEFIEELTGAPVTELFTPTPFKVTGNKVM